MLNVCFTEEFNFPAVFGTRRSANISKDARNTCTMICKAVLFYFVLYILSIRFKNFKCVVLIYCSLGVG